MAAIRDPRSVSSETGYYYRRTLGPMELLPAVGVGIAAGLIGFYLARILMQREPLRLEEPLPRVPRTLALRKSVDR